MKSKKFNRGVWIGLCVAGVTTAIALTLRADDKDEVKMKLDDAPAAVKATILKEAEGSAVGDVEKEIKNGKTVYEADAKIGNNNYEIKVAEDGTLISKKPDNGNDEKKDGDKDKDDDKKMTDKD